MSISCALRTGVGGHAAVVAEALQAGVEAPDFALNSRPDRNLHFPLLADFDPKGEVARQYGVYNDEIGMSERALFVVAGDGTR